MNFLLYDDVIHLNGACEAYRVFGPYRQFVYWLTCLLGAEPLPVKIFNLACLLASFWFLHQGVFSEARESKSFKPIAYFLHPLVLFPFFYASQISTAITVLWLSMTLYGLNLKSRGKAIAFTLLSACASVVVRSEAAVLLLVCGLPIVFYRWYWRNDRSSLKNLVRLLSASFLVGFIVPKLLSGYTFRYHDVVPVLTGDDLDYPAGSWLPIQHEALKHYLRSFLFPAIAPFYGRWISWYSAYSLSSQTWFLIDGGIVASLLAVAALTRKKHTTLSCFVFSVLVFSAICLGASFRSRPDWYFLSRTTVPAIFAGMIFVDHLKNEKRYRLLWLVSAVCLFSTLVHVVFHYRSEEAFLSYERRFSSESPAFHIAQGDYHKSHREYDLAIEEYHQAYALIPPEVAATSARARAYKTVAVYEGFRISKLTGNTYSAKTALTTLMSYNNFYSAIACFLSKEFTDEECVISENRDRFCKLVNEPMNRIFLKNAISQVQDSISRLCGDSKK